MLSRMACAIAAAAWAAHAAGADAPAAWLDQATLPTWNAPGARIPTAPKSEPEAFLARQCAKLVRPGASATDRAVAAAGWKLMGAAQRFGDTEVVGGQSAFDGMCRPRGFQFFVFSGGRFAGTVSPVPMESREDGAAQVPQLVSAGDVVVPFLRYAPSDPLCCPSRITTVQYRLQKGKSGPVLVATDATSAPTGEPRAPAPGMDAARPPGDQLR
jgi:hypothetical protein